MCLIVLGWRAHPRWRLVVAANRDEWRDRPTARAAWWSDAPALFAGRDLQAGGTWMGITRGGRFAAVTNFRDPSERRSTARSRGELASGFLLGHAGPMEYLEAVAARAGEYNGFNLIVGDAQALAYFGTRAGAPREVEPGVHGLSNHVLDEPWPKVTRARAVMREALAHDDPSVALFAMLGEANPVADAQLPATGVGLAWERRLACALITGEDYGTLSSTVLAIDAAGGVFVEERTRDANGQVTTAIGERFAT